jgi:glutamine amidotransferase
MSASVTIVDYGVGNLRSVQRAFEHMGVSTALSSDPAAIKAASRLVLPGVGAFGHCMQELKKRNLVEPVLEAAASGKPLMGICVGMQILLSVGEEFGEHEGLGLIPGRVRPMPCQSGDGRPYILPSIGWRPIHSPAQSGWQHALLQDLPEGSPMYFLHSFSAITEDPAAQLAVYDFYDMQATAVIGRDNIIGLQFHPEKSAATGLHLIKQFSVL